jgi:hypothetical protein
MTHIQQLKFNKMAKVTLEYDFNEEREEMESCINGWKWKMVVWDLDQHLRSEMKYNDKITEEVYMTLEKLREKLHELRMNTD